jgi:diguanylate cyclase (GGDEF)-like protein
MRSLHAGGQGYAVLAVSYGRRLALFVLIVLVPTLVLVGIFLIVSNDSRRGKADARLAASLETAIGLYSERVADGEAPARQLSRDPALARAVISDDRRELASLAQGAVSSLGVTAVEIDDEAGEALATAGSDEAIAFASLRLEQRGQPAGTLRVSMTTASEYGQEVRRLTARELVVSRGGTPLTATVTPPGEQVTQGETVDLELEQGEFRAHLLALDGDESLLLLGPRTEGGALSFARPAAVLLIGFLLVAVGLAYALARALTRLHTRVEEQALTDPLMGIWNRRRMAEILSTEVRRSIRFGHPISLLILDIDDFKQINDTEGHLQGDAALESIAEVVRGVTRSIDEPVRYGGDEIALILPETDAEGAAALAERLRTDVRETEVPRRQGGTLGITVSVGVATVPRSASDVDSLIDAADKALLRAKRAGKDMIRTAPARRGEGTRTASRNRGRAGARTRGGAAQ